MSNRHSQFTWEYCLDNLTRPQLFIWFETTTEREKLEAIAKQEARWEIASNLIATMYNTAMGNKKKHKGKDFMPDFDKIRKEMIEQSLDNNELINMAKKKGLNVPEK